VDARHQNKKKQISSHLSKTNASISVPIVKEVTAALINESPLDGTLDGWKTKPVSFDHGREYLTITELSQCNTHKIPSSS
jgi:hypothetical protein